MLRIPRSLLTCASVFLLAACPDSESTVLDPDPPETSGPPASQAQSAVYRVTLTGRVGFFSGGENGISQSATLYIMPPRDNAASANNGPNPVDIAIVTDASPIVGFAGALWFGTHTATCAVVNCSATLRNSGVDIAYVTRSGNRISVQVDGNIFGLPTARINTFNIYNVTSGVTAQIHNVLLGEIELLTSGSQISGQMLLNGASGFGHPTPTSYYQVAISGQLQR